MIKFFTNKISFLFPNLFAKIAIDKLSNPQVRKLREREIKVLETGEQNSISFKNHTIRTYAWKGEKEKILLIHGWEGQAGNFADLITTLNKKGHHIIAFDAPAHGFSSREKTNLFDFTELVGKMIKTHKVSKLISHSFGGVATTFALYQNQDIHIKKYGILTIPDKFQERIIEVADQYGIHKKVISKIVEKLESERGIKVSKLNVSSFVTAINVENALIIHDKYDKVISVEKSKKINSVWPQSSFIEVERTGHFGILRDQNVINKMVDFIT